MHKIKPLYLLFFTDNRSRSVKEPLELQTELYNIQILSNNFLTHEYRRDSGERLLYKRIICENLHRYANILTDFIREHFIRTNVARINI